MTEDFEVAGESGALRGVITIPSAGLKGCAICLHGNPNGDLHGNEGVFNQVADAIAPEGFATIQFSLNGSLPSDGLPENTCLRSQLADFDAILSYTRGRFSSPIHVIGESAGATIASLRWKEEIATYVLLWPAFDLSDSDLKPYLSEHWQSVVRRDGLLRDNGVILGAELINELLTTDFGPSFRLPAKPILIAHGQMDEEVPYKQSLKAISTSSAPFLFHSNPEAGHGFKLPEHRRPVIDLVRFWFRHQ